MARSQSISNSRRRSSAYQGGVAGRTSQPSPVSTDSVREKCQSVLFAALREGSESNSMSTSKIKELCCQIETEIFKVCSNSIGNDYKTSMRSHLVNLKDKRNDLRERLLSGEVCPSAFARMSTEDMSTAERKKQDEELRQRALEQSIVTRTTTESIVEAKLQDGREREKWGVSASAAAVDGF